MSNWTSNTAPNWYQNVADDVMDTRPSHPADNGALSQTDRGWERTIRFTDQNGNVRTKSEVVVADRQAQADTVSLYITDVRVANATDYSTATPTVAGSTAGDSYDIVVTFNQAVALGDAFTWDLENTPGTVAVATYKSGNQTSAITLTVDTSAETAARPISLNPAMTAVVGKLDSWDVASGAAGTLTIAAGANTAVLHGFPFQILANDTACFANTVVE